MNTEDRIYQEALRVATMYYYQGLTTEAIAKEMKFSRPKVSRLLSHARDSGMVEINIVNIQKTLSPIEERIKERYHLNEVHIVPAPELMGEVVWLERVARFAANYLNTVLSSGQSLAIAWGTTISEIARESHPKAHTRAPYRAIERFR